MKTKKYMGLFICLGIIISIIYIILAVKPLSHEYQFTPVWKISTANPVVNRSPAATKDQRATMYFHLGQTLGYFDEDGSISLYETFPSKVSISDFYYATYNSAASNTEFFRSNGEKAGIIETAGFPYFVDELVYVFLPGGNSFSKCSSSGRILWTFEGTFPITAFAAKNQFTAVGLANGNIKVLDNATGTTVTEFAPGGSDYPVILGLDISDDGQYIASVSGHNHQRFVLSHREENQQKIIYHKFFDNDSPLRTVVRFCNDGKRVFYNYHDGLGIYNLEDKSEKTIPLKNKIISVEESKDFVILLGKDKSNYTVSVIDNTNTLEGSFSFKAESAFIKARGNEIYLGKDSSISRMTVSKE